MNIFILDQDPKQAAMMMCDKHINKMIIESQQILSCVLDKRYQERHLSKDKDALTPSKQLGLPQYPKAHAKHPCTLWALESRANFRWLLKHTRQLVSEYSFRYRERNGARKVHSLEGNLSIYEAQGQYLSFPVARLTPFAQAMPVEYKEHGNAVAAYRTYYLMDKSFAKWEKHRGAPTWYKYGRLMMLRQTRGYLLQSTFNETKENQVAA
jgi:hypothetical protein